MNQLFSALLFAVLLIATVDCEPKTKNTANEVLQEDTVLNGGHNSFNSLDIEGVYKAVLPCADCEGIETKITLKQEMTFLKQTKYLGKDEKFYDEKGTYTW
ncbi:MAG: copper resistance protein NlpE, partial [Bacteroidales bacterium]